MYVLLLSAYGTPCCEDEITSEIVLLTRLVQAPPIETLAYLCLISRTYVDDLKKTDRYSRVSLVKQICCFTKIWQLYAGCGDAVVTQVFAVVNFLRGAEQLPALACDTQANTIATAWSQEMCRCDSKNAYEYRIAYHNSHAFGVYCRKEKYCLTSHPVGATHRTLVLFEIC